MMRRSSFNRRYLGAVKGGEQFLGNQRRLQLSSLGELVGESFSVSGHCLRNCRKRPRKFIINCFANLNPKSP